MASQSARKSSLSSPQITPNRSASRRVRFSPNHVSSSQVSTVEERSFSRSILSNSSFSSSVAEYTCNESFDVLPKTDYTYASSGSYSPRHLRKNYVSPNMSRQSLRGGVTPPVSMLEDSDSESEFNSHMEVDEEVQVRRHADNSISTANNHTYSNASGTYSQSFERDELDFDSDKADGAVSERVGNSGSPVDQKERAEMENRIIQNTRRSADGSYRHYYDGMVLRSGSHLKGMKQFLEKQEPNRRKSTSVLNQQSSSLSMDLQGHNSTAEQNMSRSRSDGSSLYSTIITKTVTEIEEETVDTNNSARKAVATEVEEESVDINNSAHTRRGAKGRSSWRSADSYRNAAVEEYDDESKRTIDEFQQEKSAHRLQHLYGLDHSDDFSDSDTYTDSLSSSTVSERYVARRPRKGVFTKYIFKMLDTIKTVLRFLTFPLWYMAGANGKQGPRWMWTKIVNGIAYFILLDAWVLSRRVGRGCCLCLPFLLLLPLLGASAYYGGHYLQSVTSFFPSSIVTTNTQETTHIHKVDVSQTVNLRQEVRQILLQLQNEQRQWLTRAEVEALIRGMLNPEMESLRISLLNIANEGNFDQSSIRVDQKDAKMRLISLEEQLAVLQARAKNLEREMSDGKSDMDLRLAGNQERQTTAQAEMQAAILTLQGQVDAMQGAFNTLTARTKKCCHNETATIALIRSHVNEMITEMLGGKDGKGTGKGMFAGWLQQNFVDRGEFERQLRILTSDITDRISSSMGAQRASSGSAIVLPAGAGSLSEDAVRLIVEDALLKYSADRTGLPDYALESSGGSVINVRCSETYYKKTALVSVWGIPLWYTSNSPRTVIQPEVHPGQCWAFKGTSGFIVIQLSVPIRPTGFSLEHIPKSLSIHGNIESAPRDFAVFGLGSEKDTVGINLGNFTYKTVGKPIQFFEVQIRNPGVFYFVELRVLSNHGNKDYTCLYRFRVHGVPQHR